MKADYIKIKIPSASSWSMIPDPYDISEDGNTFKTKAIISDKSHDGFSVIQNQITQVNSVNIENGVIKKYYNFTENINDADYVILPYYLGNDFISLVKGTLDKNGYIIINQKSKLERVEDTLNVYKEFNNTILGIINYKHLPKNNPKYDGEYSL